MILTARPSSPAKCRCLVTSKCEEILVHVKQDNRWDRVWKFKELLEHKHVKKEDTKEDGNWGRKGCQNN